MMDGYWLSDLGRNAKRPALLAITGAVSDSRARAIDPRRYERRLPKAIALFIVLTLSLALWAVLWQLVKLLWRWAEPVATVIASIAGGAVLGMFLIGIGLRIADAKAADPITLKLSGFRVIAADNNVVLGGADVVALAHAADDAPVPWGSEDYVVVINNARFRFVNEANRAEFMRDPTAVLPAYGAGCGMGMAVPDGKGPGPHWTTADPKYRHHVGGRLIVNTDSAKDAMWLLDISGHVKQADQNWDSGNYSVWGKPLP